LFQELPVPRHSESTLAAIKQAVPIVALVGDYLPLHRAGSKFKALCPFHDDHNPSLELNPERQSFKCWSCGAGGDIFDFVQQHERVDFPEALRMLAERAGIALETPTERSSQAGPSKADLLAASAWAEEQFAAALKRSEPARAYIERRGLSGASVARFRLGYAPDQRDWLQSRGKAAGFSPALLEQAGLVARNPETGLTRDRFRGRLIFPIHDLRGRAIGFGGRILPEIEKTWTEQGKRVAKYLNSSETLLFQKRRNLYAADLARAAARQAGWVAVVEGYTDVIAAHQAGLENVVGTLGTALGDDHVQALRRLADRVVLVFDGDEAGQKAADRSLELFLAHEVDLRVLTLPAGLDPCDFLLSEGAGAFRALVDRAADPLDFAIDRAAARFDFDAPEGARQAAEWVLSILARVPVTTRGGLPLKIAKALDTLARRLRLPVSELQRGLARLRRPASRTAPASEPPADSSVSANQPPIRLADLDPVDRELVSIALNHPELVGELARRVPAESLRDVRLRRILQAAYELEGEKLAPAFDRVSLRLEDPADRSLAAGLLLPMDPQPVPDAVRPAAVEARLAGLLSRLEERRWRERLREVEAALAEARASADEESLHALRRERFRVFETLQKLNGRSGRPAHTT
jgi:DNA primase